MSNKAFRAHIKADKAKPQRQCSNSVRANDVPHQDMSERDHIIERLKRKGKP